MGKELQESDNDAETLESSDSSSDMDEGELYESVFDMGDKSDLFRGWHLNFCVFNEDIYKAVVWLFKDVRS